MTPPEASSGSATKQATVSGPSARILSSRSFTFGGAELFLRHVVRPAVGIGGGKVVHGVGHEIEQAWLARFTGDGGREIDAAVVGVLARDDVWKSRLNLTNQIA